MYVCESKDFHISSQILLSFRLFLILKCYFSSTYQDSFLLGGAVIPVVSVTMENVRCYIGVPQGSVYVAFNLQECRFYVSFNETRSCDVTSAVIHNAGNGMINVKKHLDIIL